MAVANEVLLEGLSRVRKCSFEGRATMGLDLGGWAGGGGKPCKP